MSGCMFDLVPPAGDLVPPAGFEPALTAPEGVAPSGPDQRKRAHGRPFWTRIGHRADSRRSRPCRSLVAFQSRGAPSRAPDPPTRYTAPAAAGMACNEDARAGDRGPAGSWAVAGHRAA